MSLLPSERHAVLVIDTDAVATGLIAFQLFKAVASRNADVVEPRGYVQHLQLPLGGAPGFARDSSSGASVPLTKQIGGCGVAERLNHNP